MSELNQFSIKFIDSFRANYPELIGIVDSQLSPHGEAGYVVIRLAAPNSASGELMLITENDEITVVFAGLFHSHCSSIEEAFALMDEILDEELCVAAYYRDDTALGGCSFHAGEDPLKKSFPSANRVIARSWNGTYNLDWRAN